MSELFDRGFDQGGIAALKEFRLMLLAGRELIEDDDEPVFDGILGLLERCIAEVAKSNKVLSGE